MRIDIVVIITIVVTHYAKKILDIFDRKVVAVIRKIKTKIKESFKHKTQKPDLKIRKRANVYQTLTQDFSENEHQSFSEITKVS